MPENNEETTDIYLVMVGVVALAIVIISLLTITAIMAGPPAV